MLLYRGRIVGGKDGSKKTSDEAIIVIVMNGDGNLNWDEAVEEIIWPIF